MKGIVNQPLNNRLSPSVNAEILGFFDKNDVVHLITPVLGDSYEGNEKWYKLFDGSYVWSGAVDVEADCAELSPADRMQWLISYRKLDRRGKPDLSEPEPDDRLYFTPVSLPAEEASIRFTPEVAPAHFVNGFMQSISEISKDRSHVFIYIHGYELKMRASLKTDLFNHFVQNYLSHPKNKIAKVVFMSWPGEGKAHRRDVDDRSIIAGEEFTKKGLFETFELLAKALEGAGMSLNLMVHSFGHQLLNGMLNPPDLQDRLPQKPIFKNIFLMAPDITHLCVQNGGVDLPNRFQDGSGRQSFRYDLTGLNKLASDVHVFYDKSDYLLYTSTKKFIGGDALDKETDRIKREMLSKDFRNLGNYGKSRITHEGISNFNFIEIAALLNNIKPYVSLKYPFDLQRKMALNAMNRVENEVDYRGIDIGQILLNINQFPDFHRYLYTCEPVVANVLSLL